MGCWVDIRKSDTQKESLVVSLRGELTRHEVRAVRDRVLQEIHASSVAKYVALDISKLERIDTAGVALLVLLCRYVDSIDGTFRVLSPSDKVRRVLRLAQVEEFLNIENGNGGA